MMPRNFTLFRFPVGLPVFEPRERHDGASFSIEEPLALEGLRECALAPVGPLELESRGFVPPMGSACEDLAIVQPGALWLAVGFQQRMLPPAVVAEALGRKLAEIERTEGRRLGGRMRKQIRDELVQEMLPKAFVRTRRVDVLLDLERGLCAVDTTSRKVADAVVSEIRRAIGSFPALPLNAEVAPRAVLTGWIAGDPLPAGLALGEECLLKEADDHGAAVRCTRQDLQSDEIERHLEAGKQVTRLGLTLDDRVGFVLGDDLVLRKWHLLDAAALEEADPDNIQEELHARFALTLGNLREVFDTLEPALRISQIHQMEG